MKYYEPIGTQPPLTLNRPNCSSASRAPANHRAPDPKARRATQHLPDPVPAARGSEGRARGHGRCEPRSQTAPSGPSASPSRETRRDNVASAGPRPCPPPRSVLRKSVHGVLLLANSFVLQFLSVSLQQPSPKTRFTAQCLHSAPHLGGGETEVPFHFPTPSSPLLPPPPAAASARQRPPIPPRPPPPLPRH